MNMYDRFWFQELWEGYAQYHYGEITFGGFLAFHFKCTLCAYYIFFNLLAILATAFLTIAERCVIADFQGRKGPKKTGYNGYLQPIADATKLILKERISVAVLVEPIFTAAGIASFVVACIVWPLMPLGLDMIIANVDFTSFMLFNFSVFHIFAFIFAGIASVSKYATLGSLRTAAQMLSYELTLASTSVILIKNSKELSILAFDYLNTQVASFIYYFIGFAIIFFIASLAELNRHPFDLPEAEAELVAGYNIEYSGIRFALFFLAEYLSCIYYAMLFNKHYIGENESFLINCGCIAAVIILIIAIRALIPRYRYDQLMRINWKFFLPVLILFIWWLTFLEFFLI